MGILFLCGGYYPNTSATGNCVKSIADLFSKNGYGVKIISKSANEKSYTDEINGQSIYRITNKRLIGAAKLAKEKDGIVKDIHTIFYKSYWAINQLLKADGLDSSLVSEYVRQGEKIISETNIEAIVPCCMPAECLLAGYKLQEKHNELKLFPLLYDPYSENLNFF